MGIAKGSMTRRGFVKASAGAAATMGLAGCNNDKQAEPEQSPKDPSKLAIIHTNDTHGYDLFNDESLGLAAVAQLKKDWEKKGYEVLLFDCGDAVQGENLVNLTQGKAAIDFLNEVGYDVMTLGNHEFDFGQDYIEDYVNAATFPIISANILAKATNTSLVAPFTVFTLKDGRKVGVFGLTTPETSTKANPLLVGGLMFLQEKELYKCAQEQIEKLKAKGCELIVCLGHLGEDEGSAPNRASDVVANTKGIDLFVDGHDHKEENQTLKDAEGNDVLVVEADCYTHMIGVVTWEDGKLEEHLVKHGEYDGQDASVAAAVQEVADKNEKELDVVVAQTSYELNGERNPGVRTEETNLADLLADAVLWEAQQYAEVVPDAAIVNGGSIRQSIPAGEITCGAILDTVPFLNYICTIEVSGSNLLEALEASCFDTPEEMGGFPQVAGITYTVDTTTPYEKGEQYPDSTYYAPAKPGSRVTIDEVNGEPFDLNATYTIAAADFVCYGGDTYYVFSEAAKDTLKGTSYIIHEALKYYLIQACLGTVPTEYARPQGRITIKE